MSRTVDCAAVDLGATSGRVIVGSWRDHRLELTEVHRFRNAFRGLNGHEYWDLPYLWAEVSAGLLAAKRRFPRMASVGVDSWAVDHVLVDAKGAPVFPVHAYRDLRTQQAAAALGRKGIKAVYGATGIPNYPYNTSLQLQETIRAHPAVTRVASRCLFIADYFNFLLSGKMVNELSLCSHSQLLDVNGAGWAKPAFRHFGVPAAWFGPPMTSPRRLGPIRSLAELKGVESVLVPGHDTACAFAAMPATDDGRDVYISTGTWSLVGFESDRPLLGAKALRERISNERMGDGSYRPLRSCLGLWLVERLVPEFQGGPVRPAQWKEWIGDARALREAPERLEVGDSSLFNPPSMRAAIDAQLKRRRLRPPGSLAGYLRLIFDSLGGGHAKAVNLLSELSGRAFGRVLLAGGGARNPVLCQATADATRLPVQATAHEGAAVGNISSQLVALGVVESAASFRAHFREQAALRTFEPA